MLSDNRIKKINERYNPLAESCSSLSCGGALNFADISPGFTCVDLGCGRGADALRMAEITGATGQVFGIDASEGMLEKARENAEVKSVKNIDFIISDLENIRLDNEAVDFVLSNCTINHAEDKYRVWKEIYRILKNGRCFVVSDIYSIQEIPALFKNDAVAVAECWAGADTKKVYIETVKMAGFTNIKVIEESTPYKKGEADIVSFTITGMKHLPQT